MGHGGERGFQVSHIQLQLQLAMSLVEQISINLGPIIFRVNWGDFPVTRFGDLSELSGLSPVWALSSRWSLQGRGDAQVNSQMLPPEQRPGDPSGRPSGMGALIKSSCLHSCGHVAEGVPGLGRAWHQCWPFCSGFSLLGILLLT